MIPGWIRVAGGFWPCTQGQRDRPADQRSGGVATTSIALWRSAAVTSPFNSRATARVAPHPGHWSWVRRWKRHGG